jgi:hypothetical protein
VVLVLLGYVLPRRARIVHEPDRLVIHRPVAARLLGDLRLFLAGALVAYFLAVFLISREWVLVTLGVLVLLRMAWSVKRNRDRRQIVVDATANRISEGSRSLGPASDLIAVQISPGDTASVVLVFRDAGKGDGIPRDRREGITAADAADARTIGTAIARYLNVPIVETA